MRLSPSANCEIVTLNAAAIHLVNSVEVKMKSWMLLLLVAASLTSCKSTGNHTETQCNSDSLMVPQRTESKLTKQMPEYYGIFYIGPDSLIELFKGDMRMKDDYSPVINSSSPQFYVYGHPQTECRINFETPNRELRGWRTRVYPKRDSEGVLIHKVTPYPGVKLTPNKYELSFSNGFDSDSYPFTVIDSPPSHN
jgi:hypothetical protein